MSDQIDSIHFKDLAACDPQDVCRRADSRYDDGTGSYRLTIWGEEYSIDPVRKRIDCLSNRRHHLHDYFYLFIVHYLLSVQAVEIAGEWISEKDIPGGSAFFRGPHEIPTGLIADRLDEDRVQFAERCRQLHGTQLKMADVAYGFTIAPRIPVAVLGWEGDEDFPAEAKILYDKTIVAHLALDVVFALAVGVCQQLGAPY